MTDSAPRSFDTLGLPAGLLATLKELGHELPTPVQEAAIPPLLEGRDVLGQAATGTGKTAAFTLPMLARLDTSKRAPLETSCLVLVPTRELAMQVTEAIRRYGASMQVHVIAVYGGEPIGYQLKQLKRGVDIVVATPGRALDHLERKTLKLHRVQSVVLDEADEMLDMGFEEDLKTLLDALPPQRQMALFSATMPPRIQKIAERHLLSPVRGTIKRQQATAGETPKVRQVAYVVPRAHKVAALVRVLQSEDARSALVFCQTRAEVDELSALLPDRGMSAEALHGGLDQTQRDRVMKRFKSEAVRVLIATDVAARGLDIDHLALVVNYEAPTTPEVYVHRIGRTGRAGREGVAVTLVEPSQIRIIKNLERAAGGVIKVLPVPTAETLRAARIEKTKAHVLEAARNGAGETLHAWVKESGVEAWQLAAAATMLLHEEHFGTETLDEINIPVPRASIAKAQQFTRPVPPRMHQHSGGERGERPERQDRGRPAGGDDDKVTLFVGAGTEAGIRPADLVGAIANEAKVESRLIGPIQIRERYALVGVPADRVEEIIRAMRATKVRGRKVQVRREREP